MTRPGARAGARRSAAPARRAPARSACRSPPRRSPPSGAGDLLLLARGPCPLPPHAGNGGTGGMKRRLPTTAGRGYVGGDQPPAAHRDANRHSPTASHPGKRRGRGERRSDRGQRERAARGRPERLPPSSTASAANPAPSRGARAGNRRTHPRAVVTAPPPGPRPGGPRTARQPPRRSPCRSSRPRPAARPARTPAATHGSPGTRPHRSLGMKILAQRPAART